MNCLKSIMISALRGMGLELINYQKDSSHNLDNAVLINIGSGNWECNGWKCLDYPSEWYSKAQSRHSIIPYDIRNDSIPFANDSVDAIYCSHVVEHIEDKYIKLLFGEAYRILKVGGVFRVYCPDAEFLYQIAKSGMDDYWVWRKKWFTSKFWVGEKPKSLDYLIREIATPKLKGYVNALSATDYSLDFSSLEMYDFFVLLTKDLEFRDKYVGDHINFWTYMKMEKMLNDAGFTIVLRSKWNGSISKYMQNRSMFDTTFPQMSLYVEAVKN